ncbi:RluA family pseudouridine synthase [Alphaproteobacteria bacterium]|nr:RluA family pseudouridine synthase [Alphaproteobacteria bacterium]
MMPEDSPDDKKSGPQWWLQDVPEDEDGTRLDRFLRRLIEGLLQSEIEKMLRSGLIRLDGAKAKPASRIATGQVVRLPPHLRQGVEVADKPVLAKPSIMWRDPALVKQFDAMIIAEGPDWLAINKPSGLAVQGGSGTNRHVDGMLMALASGQADRLRLVHRIDKDTSGVLLLSKNRMAARRLSADFQERRIEKTYLALVMDMPAPAFDIRHRLAKQDGRAGEKMMVMPEGQTAHTKAIRLDAMGRKLALMALRPLTGRTHQLRVHMAYEGYPIVGDGKYGGQDAHPGGLVAKRLHLHAWRLHFDDNIRIQAPLTDHMKVSLTDLGLEIPQSEWPFDDA